MKKQHHCILTSDSNLHTRVVCIVFQKTGFFPHPDYILGLTTPGGWKGRHPAHGSRITHTEHSVSSSQIIHDHLTRMHPVSIAHRHKITRLFGSLATDLTSIQQLDCTGQSTASTLISTSCRTRLFAFRPPLLSITMDNTITVVHQTHTIWTFDWFHHTHRWCKVIWRRISRRCHLFVDGDRLEEKQWLSATNT